MIPLAFQLQFLNPVPIFAVGEAWPESGDFVVETEAGEPLIALEYWPFLRGDWLCRYPHDPSDIRANGLKRFATRAAAVKFLCRVAALYTTT